MSCTSSMVETRLLEAAMPHINDLCSKHWKNIEREDRVAEASLFFIEALRRLPLNTGHFIQDFDNVLFEHMDALNRKTPSRLFGSPSLDHPISSTKDDKWSGYDLLAAPQADFSYLDTDTFISTLDKSEQSVIRMLINGVSRAETARVHGMTQHQLKKLLDQIGKKYMQWDS